MKKTKKKIFLIIFFIILLLLLIFSVFFSLVNIRNDNIFNGISINNIDISGLSKEDATSKIATEVWHFFYIKIFVSVENVYFFCKFFAFSLAYCVVLC